LPIENLQEKLGNRSLKTGLPCMCKNSEEIFAPTDSAAAEGGMN